MHTCSAGEGLVSVRKMHSEEASAVLAIATAGGEGARELDRALAEDPHAVRVIHIGHEVLGAFLLNELPGHVEQVSCITLNEEGKRSGAEPLLLDYVVKAARFSRKEAVEVVARSDSVEAAHLLATGFAPAGEAPGGRTRYRLTLKKK